MALIFDWCWSWHLFEKAKAEKKKAYWCGANLYINDTKVTA
jgi:hypothetical protein